VSWSQRSHYPVLLPFFSSRPVLPYFPAPAATHVVEALPAVLTEQTELLTAVQLLTDFQAQEITDVHCKLLIPPKVCPEPSHQRIPLNLCRTGKVWTKPCVLQMLAQHILLFFSPGFLPECVALSRALAPFTLLPAAISPLRRTKGAMRKVKSQWTASRAHSWVTWKACTDPVGTITETSWNPEKTPNSSAFCLPEGCAELLRSSEGQSRNSIGMAALYQPQLGAERLRGSCTQAPQKRGRRAPGLLLLVLPSGSRPCNKGNIWPIVCCNCMFSQAEYLCCHQTASEVRNQTTSALVFLTRGLNSRNFFFKLNALQ